MDLDFFSLIVSAVISVFVAYLTAKASSYSKDVVGERSKWREKIRDLTVSAVKEIRSANMNEELYNDITSEFRLRLNPDDEEDQHIMLWLHRGGINPSEDVAKEILARVSILLKHDWERAKNEAKVFPFRLFSYLIRPFRHYLPSRRKRRNDELTF